MRACYVVEVDGKPGEPAHHQVEIAHESLLQAWPRLVRWQTQDEDSAQLRDQLKQAAHLWEDKGRSADLLWTGTAFQEFDLWRQRTGHLTAVEAAFARAMAERARRRERLRRAVVASIIVALSAVAVAVGVSRQQAARARDWPTQLLAGPRPASCSPSRRLRLTEDPTEALLLAGISLEQADTREARAFLMKALREAPLAFELVVGDHAGRMPAFSPDGKWLAAGGHFVGRPCLVGVGHDPIVLPGALDQSSRDHYPCLGLERHLGHWISRRH